MITGREIREALLLVNWSLEQLARAARLPFNTVMRAELLDRQAVGTAVHATAAREAPNASKRCVKLRVALMPDRDLTASLQSYPKQPPARRLALVRPARFDHRA